MNLLADVFDASTLFSSHSPKNQQPVGANIDSQVNEPPRPYGYFQELQTGIVTSTPGIDCDHPAGQYRPTIQLRGQWLATAGFLSGRSFAIEVYEGMLIVMLDSATQPPNDGD